MSKLLALLLKRLLSLLATLFITTALLYATVMLTPVETRAELFMPKNSSPRMTEEMRQKLLEKIIEKNHLNDPYPVQYAYWLANLAQGNWGYSPVMQENVLDAILLRTPATAELMLFSLLVFIPFGLLSGVVAAAKSNRMPDHTFRLAAFTATSLPPFILALVLMSIFYVELRWFAPERSSAAIGYFVKSNDFVRTTGLLTIDGLLNGRPDISLDALRHLAMPVFTLAIAHWATLGRVTRVTMMDELQQDYVTAARARGISERGVVWNHALRNAFTPALTSSLLSAASLLTGVYVVEILFNFHGISDVAVSSMAFIPDAAAALGFAIYNVIVVWLLMTLLDALQVILDPRLRHGA